MENKVPDTRTGMCDAAEALNNVTSEGFSPPNIDCFIARYMAKKHPEAEEEDRECGTGQV